MKWGEIIKSHIDMNPLNKAKSYLWFGILPNTFKLISPSLSPKSKCHIGTFCDCGACMNVHIWYAEH